MALPRFHCDPLQVGDVTLDEAEARHLSASRRLAAGDAVMLFDGAGHEARAVVQAAKGTRARLSVAEVERRPRLLPQLTLAVAVPKGPRQDWLIEKCTELGVAAIVPLVTQRSVSQASEHRLDKWRRTAIEAAKQSGQSWLPDLCEPAALPELIQRFGEYERVVIASASATTAAAALGEGATILALVGPEGDFAPDELHQAQAAGAVSMTLGPNVLRVETAAVAIAALIHARQG